MLKHRCSVSQEFYPSDYFFAVYPVSLEFQRQYQTRFNLYFQKNLQIISKNQCPFATVKKDQVVHFTKPDQAHPFRVQSQKKLDYSWSLYIFRIDIEGDNEQFIEGQKITLKQEWNFFKSQRQCLLEKNIKFNTICCKLNYVVIIARNNEEVFDLAQKYFEQKASVITSDQKIAPFGEQIKEVANGQDLKVQSNLIVPSGSETIQNQQREDQIKCIKVIDDMKFSGIVQNDQQSLQLNFTTEPKSAELIQNQLSPRDEQIIRMTNSEIEIGKQIEEIVTIKEASLKGQNNETPQQEVKITEEGEQKNIKMINSQLLNEKKQVIEPIFKQKKFIIAFFLLVILVVGGGFWTLSRKNLKVAQSNKKEKNKLKQVKKDKSKK